MTKINTYYKSAFFTTVILIFFILQTNLISSQVKNNKNNLFISVFDLKINIKSYTLLDVRNSSKFKKSHITGSLNISINSIQNKKHLINRKIVIINNGYSSFYVLKKIIKLKKLKFSVCLLDGGINTWTLKNYPLSNNNRNSFNNFELSSIDLYKSLRSTSWLALNLSGKKVNSTDLSKLKTISFPTLKNYIDDNKQISNNLEKSIITSINKNIEKRKLLVYTNTGKWHHKINNILKKLNIDNIFYLTDGLEGYKYFTKRVLSFPIAVKTLNEEDNCDCN